MPAAASDLFIKVGDPGTATTLSAPGYTIGNTSITVASTTNFATDTGVIFAIDRAEVVNGEEVRVAGSYCVFEGVVTSSTAIGSVDLLYGTPQDYPAGALTRVYITVSAVHTNRLVDGLLNFADQDGTLKAGAVDNAAVLASDVVTTAKILNSNVTTAKLADGAVTAVKLGDVDWQKTFIATSATSVTGTWVSKVRNTSGTDNPVELAYESSSQNDEIFFKTVLAAGTYSFFILTDKDVNRGQAQLRIDATNTGSALELYNGTRVNSFYSSLATGVSVAATGLKTISVKMATKNASSLAYVISLNRLVIVRTA